jgi:hypothetical protein
MQEPADVAVYWVLFALTLHLTPAVVPLVSDYRFADLLAFSSQVGLKYVELPDFAMGPAASVRLDMTRLTATTATAPRTRPRLERVQRGGRTLSRRQASGR